MCHLPESGIKPMSSALPGWFFTTEPPLKPQNSHFWDGNIIYFTKFLCEVRKTTENYFLKQLFQCLESALKVYKQVKKHLFLKKYITRKITDSLCRLNLKQLPLSPSLFRKLDFTLSTFRKNTSFIPPTGPIWVFWYLLRRVKSLEFLTHTQSSYGL